jgi:hypothetical protein
MLTRKRPQPGTRLLDSPHPWRLRTPLIGLLVLYLTATPGLANTGDRPPQLKPVSQRTTTPYPAVRLTSFVFDQPRPIRAWSARIDLTAEGVELIATCPGDVEPPSETACATTLEFAKNETVQLAINASPFSPFRQKSGAGMDVVGLAACNGKVFSQPHQDFGALVETQSGSVEIWSPPIDRAQQDTIEDAVSGFRVLVRDGKSQAEQVAAKVAKGFAGVNPRSAVGLSADGKTLWLIAVDGRNTGRSEGMTLTELAAFGISLGCDDLLNLDGGGSTTLVMQDPASGQWRVLNEPVGRKIVGTHRLVANNLGVRLPRAPRKNP